MNYSFIKHMYQWKEQYFETRIDYKDQVLYKYILMWTREPLINVTDFSANKKLNTTLITINLLLSTYTLYGVLQFFFILNIVIGCERTYRLGRYYNHYRTTVALLDLDKMCVSSAGTRGELLRMHIENQEVKFLPKLNLILHTSFDLLIHRRLNSDLTLLFCPTDMVTAFHGKIALYLLRNQHRKR